MTKIPRVIITAHDGTPLGDLDPRQLIALVVISEVNGENAMTITTTQELKKGDRLLWRDGREYWHEYVVNGAESPHDMPDFPLHTYYCPWSLQYDLEGTYVTGMPGTSGTPATATQALTAALAGTTRWTVGTVNVTTTGGASFWRLSGWEAMQKLVEVWGGEVSTTITVSTTGIVSRAVNLITHIGASTATRRFDYGHDMRGITRTLDDQLWTARVMPLGAGEETESGGYGRKITIDPVNSNVPYLENANAVPLTRVPDGNGGWEIPVQVVENPDCDTPAKLKAWAQANLSDWTTPKVSYQADVVQLSHAGMDALGVSLGDEVVAVDKTFGETPLRIQGRALRIEEDLIDPTATVLTISNLRGSIASTLNSLARATNDVYRMIEGMSANQSSVEWVSNLIARINDEANTTGGYTYITEGQGTRTYDVAVSDPLVGAEANMVVEVKGGNIRIANSKDSGGNWEWKTLIQSGYVNSEVIRAMGSGTGGIAEVTANGLMVYIGSTLMAAFQSDAARYYDGNGSAASNVTARFGTTGATIGKTAESHMELDYRSMQLIDRNGTTYLDVRDLRDASGYAQVADNFGTLYQYGPPLALTYSIATSKPIVVKVGSTTLSSSQYTIDTSGTPDTIQLTSTSGLSGDMVVTYYTTDTDGKVYTLGTRKSGSIAGPYSYAFGESVSATRENSTAMGEGTAASGIGSYAGGMNSEARANYSHAHGLYVIAPDEAQTVIGRFNKYNTGTAHAFVIGNGSANNSRSNALTVDYGGNLTASGRVKSDAAEFNYFDTNVNVDSDNVAAGTEYSSNVTGKGVVFRNASNNNIGVIRLACASGSDRKRGVAIVAANESASDVYNSLGLYVDKDGNRSVSINQAAWLSALGLTVSETAMTINTSNTTSIGTNKVRRSGNVVTVHIIDLKIKSALANATTSYSLATVPSGYRPAYNAYGAAVRASNIGSSYWRIDTGGALTLRNQSGSSFAADTTFTGTITYVI